MTDTPPIDDAESLVADMLATDPEQARKLHEAFQARTGYALVIVDDAVKLIELPKPAAPPPLTPTSEWHPRPWRNPMAAPPTLRDHVPSDG